MYLSEGNVYLALTKSFLSGVKRRFIILVKRMTITGLDS